jgi:hypothetical protein
VADGVVPGGEEEPVAVIPVRILRPEGELVGVDGGEDVGGAETLADVALALCLTHVDDVVTDAVGGVVDAAQAVGKPGLHGLRRCACGVHDVLSFPSGGC